MNLTDKLISLRKKNGFTQATLAEKMDVTRQSISRWEIGEALPSTDNLRRLSELFGVPVDYLMNDEASAPETAVAVMEGPEPEKHGRKPTLIGVGIGFVIALAIMFAVGAFFTEYKRDVKDTTPTHPVNTGVLDEVDFEEDFDFIEW